MLPLWKISSVGLHEILSPSSAPVSQPIWYYLAPPLCVFIICVLYTHGFALGPLPPEFYTRVKLRKYFKKKQTWGAREGGRKEAEYSLSLSPP